jgi:hypothetical protein
MPLMFLLSIAIAVFFAVHVVRTGREMYWLFILLAFPFLGSLIYALAVYLPSMRNSSRAHKVKENLIRAVDPGRDVREARERLADVPSVQNRLKLAKTLLAVDDYAEAEEHFSAMLTGLHADDPDILLGLAAAQLGNGKPAAAVESLSQLREAHPDYQSAEGHLTYARALDELDRREEAVSEYRALADYYPGVEPLCRLALLLVRMGRDAEAQSLFKDVQHRLSRAPGHVRARQKEWLDLAKQNLAGGGVS